ncbi:PTS transporter subunit EIIC [Lacrimispora sp.]|uniref:PTS transporter subunit EIIC n=1 Tax=Lacrimispora sp. TaxID=2719234 RepID=UPI00345F9D46
MKDNIIGGLQKFSKAMISSVLYLPAIGMVMVVCNIFTNANITNALPILKQDWLYLPFKVIYDALLSIFANLGPIFAIGIAFGLAKKKKEHAALVAFMSLFVYLASQQSFLKLTERLSETTGGATGQAMMLGFQVINAGVFIGIIIGVVTGLIHNRYCDKDLGDIFSVYGGTKFVFILMIPIMLTMSIGFTYIWPPIQFAINSLTNFIGTSGAPGFFVFGFLNRLLIPTGLHQILESVIYYTDLGGVATIGGQVISGARNIALAEIADPGTAKLSITTVFACASIAKMFGLTGAGLAMLKCAKPEQKNKAKAIFIPAILTSALTGITEPIEFTFLFVSPVLFVIHSVLTGFALVALYLLNVTSCTMGSIIDVFLYNVPAGVAKTNWPMFLLVGVVLMVLYYFVFSWYILKFDVKTPGRDDREDITLITKKDYKEKKQGGSHDDDLEIGKKIMEAVGGRENVVSIDNCFTRLRLELKDMEKINEELLKETGSRGIVKRGNETQIIYGTNVNKFRKMLEDYMETLVDRTGE